MDPKKIKVKWALGLAMILLAATGLWLSAGTAMAADAGKFLEIGKFQVVPGSDDKAYLVDTVTGAVWVLTYRTLATGREPIAIPYKFIKSTPKNEGDFLVESLTPNVTMPVGGGQ